MVKILTGILCILMLAACQREPLALTQQSVLTQAATASVPPGKSIALTPSPQTTVDRAHTPAPATPAPLPSATQLACWVKGGRVEQDELETDLLHQPLQFRVYLPPCYDQFTDARYPVLYLIHGQSFNDDQWERLGAPAVVDRLSASGRLPAFLIVMPRDRRWTEPDDDRFGQAVIDVLIPHVDQQYRSLSSRAARAIGGLSRGGAWALHLGLTEWEMFGAVGMHSGFAFQSDVASVKRWLDAIPLEQMPRFYLDISDNDRPEIAASAAWFERLLTERGIPHEWYMFPGYHEEAYWQAHVEQYLMWYAGEW